LPLPIVWALVVGLIGGIFALLIGPTKSYDAIPVSIIGSIGATVLAHRLFDHTGIGTAMLGSAIALFGWYALGESKD